MMDEARLVEELDGLKAHTEVLKEQTIAQPDNRDAIQLYVSLNNRIAALENRLMTIQQSRGNFLCRQVFSPTASVMTSLPDVSYFRVDIFASMFITTI